MGIIDDEYIDIAVDNLQPSEDIDFDDFDEALSQSKEYGIKSHLDDGDQLVWYNDSSIVATWHSNGKIDVFEKTDISICEANFRILKGHWRSKEKDANGKDVEHGVGTEPNHWLYNGTPIKEYMSAFPDFWKATNKPEKATKKGTTTRKKKKVADSEVNYEPIKVEVADWEIEEFSYYKRVSSPLKSVICFEVEYNVFEEYSANGLDKYINNNGVYIMLNGSEPYYVGQADQAFNRVQQHTADKHKDKWEKALLFVSKNNELTKDYQDVLEMRLIDETAGRGAKIVNGTIGNKVNAVNVYTNNTMKYDSIIGFIAEASYKFGYDFLVRSTYSNKTVNAIGNVQTELAKEESKTNVIVTPRWVVEDMLNLLPEQAFGYGTTIIDFAIKDGAFLQSAFERSFNNKDLISRFPDENRRKFYISQFKLFGVIQAATQADYGIDLYANLNGIVAKEHLIVMDYERELFDRDGKIFKGKSLEILAKDIIQRFGDKDMKIDYVVGNPPYQKDTGGGKAGGTAIWPAFIDMAKSLNPEAVTMITPSRWFTGGQGITQQWRQDWMNDTHIDKLVHYPNANEVFNDTAIAGGVSYFRWNKDINNYDVSTSAGNIISYENMYTNENTLRQLNEFSVFFPDEYSATITNKVKQYRLDNRLQSLADISTLDYYGLVSNYTYKESNGIKVITSSGIKYVRANEIKNQPIGYRLAISKTTSEHAKEADKNGQYKVLAKMFIMGPDTVCSQSYMTVHGIISKNSSENLMQTIKSKIFRLLILNRTNGQNIASSAYCDIPLLDFSKYYTDQDLYQIFNLTPEEINYIEKTIKPME